MAFCDFCPCEDCLDGKGVAHSHAQTADGRWICEVCYEYDVCTNGLREVPGSREPCYEHKCNHRPEIIGEWLDAPPRSKGRVVSKVEVEGGVMGIVHYNYSITFRGETDPNKVTTLEVEAEGRKEAPNVLWDNVDFSREFSSREAFLGCILDITRN